MLQQPDREEFEQAVYKEVKHMFDKKVWEKVPQSEMMAYYNTLRRASINVQKKQLMLILSFKRKRHAAGSLVKYKARLCCHDSQQQWGAHVKTLIYLLPPAGVEINTNGEDLVLILRKNLYGLKDAGRTWWEPLSGPHERLGFKKCNSDQCVWRKEGVVIIAYVDDCCIFANEKHEADKVVKALDGEIDITDEGKTIGECQEVKVDHNRYGSFRMYQPHLLSRIIKAISGVDKANPHTTPANPTVQLNKDIDGQERKESWSYRSVIGMLHFLVNSTHLELAHSVHQCARFCETPKASHKRAVKHILRYLLTTQPAEGKEPPKYGLNVKPDMNRGIEVYVDVT
eukprot:14537299-Ditylum_brightwellii.AAC.1